MMMEYSRQAISPGLSQASCGSPNYDSEFTNNGSPGQCSMISMSPGRLSPLTLKDRYSLCPSSDSLAQYVLPSTNSSLQFVQSHHHDSPCSPLLHHDGPLSPSSSNLMLPNNLGASPSAAITSALSTPGAVNSHTSMLHTKYEHKDIARPSATIDMEATATPYSDATKPKKPAKEGRIKRPMNAFMVFAQGQRRQLTELKPELHNADISKHLGQVWKKMPENEKNLWREEAARLKEMHDREFPEYKYKPRKNKNKIQKKPVKTESGRVSKPAGKNRDTTKQPTTKAASRSKKPRSGGKKGGGNSAAATAAAAASIPHATTTTVTPEVNSSLVNMLQSGPHHRFQPIGVVAAFPPSSSSPNTEKQFNRIIIDDEFRKGVRESQKIPSSTEITPPAQTGDMTEFPVFNPAFRPEIYSAPTPSPVSSNIHNNAAMHSPASNNNNNNNNLTSNVNTPTPSSNNNNNNNINIHNNNNNFFSASAAETESLTEVDIEAFLLNDLPPAVTPPQVEQLADSNVVFRYASGACVTYNPETREHKFDNLAPLKSIPDLSSLDSFCGMDSLVVVDPTLSTVNMEIDSMRNALFSLGDMDVADMDTFGADVSPGDSDFSMAHKDEIECVSEKLPDTIFAENAYVADNVYGFV